MSVDYNTPSALQAQLKNVHLNETDVERYIRFISEFYEITPHAAESHVTTIRQLFHICGPDGIRADFDNFVGSVLCYTKEGAGVEWLYVDKLWNDATVFYHLEVMIRCVIQNRLNCLCIRFFGA